eukprot:XP_014040235.1 PREDICTED: probable lysosomal cobalamin transporter [Salmo salar]
MSVLPLNLIKGTRSVVYERLENTEDIEEVENQMEKIKAKCEDGRPLSSRDRRNLQEFEDKLQVLQRRGRHLEIAESHCCTKVGSALRPLKVRHTHTFRSPSNQKLVCHLTFHFEKLNGFSGSNTVLRVTSEIKEILNNQYSRSVLIM